MSNITLRHYKVTLGYRTPGLVRRFRFTKLYLRARISRRKIRSYLRSFFPVVLGLSFAHSS